MTSTADVSEKEPLVKADRGGNKAVVEMADADESQDFGTEIAGWTIGGAWDSFLGSSTCPDPVKQMWKENSPMFLPHVDKLRQTLNNNNKIVTMIHGFFCIFYGGAYPQISLLLAFLSVYDVMAVWKDVKGLMGGSEPVTPAKTMAVIATACKFATICYAVYFLSPFLAAVVVAIAIEPYVTASLESSPKVFDNLHQLNNQVLGQIGKGPVSVNWTKFAFVMATRSALSIVSYLLLPGTFYSVFMGLYGMTVACSMAGQSVQDMLDKGKSLGQLSLKTLILWVFVLFGTLWQSYSGYTASVLRLIVPLGFLVCYDGNISPSFWKVQNSTKDQ